jgi:hypothetical protein
MEAIAIATTDDGHSHSALDAALDIFRIRQYFNVAVRAREVSSAIRKDAVFLGTVRRGMLFGPLPDAAPRRCGAVSEWWPPVAAAPSRH